MITAHRRPVAAALTLAALLTLLTTLAMTQPIASAEPTPDPGLTQTIAADEPIVHGAHVITKGHVDMGPKFDGSTWRFLIHDDAARADKDARTVWRYPAETVLHVLDAAQLTVPQGQTYAFVGAPAGSTVWVIPQTQNPAVVWTGWNTQDPTVMSRIDRGATFSVDGVQGPGVMTVYLQSGDFGAPQVLWDSRTSDRQPVFVDTNTHTHANWVFTAPGVYLVRMTAAARLIDGSTVTDTQLLRFAVGSGTSTDAALTTAWKGAPAPSDPAPSPAQDPSRSAAHSADGQGTLATGLIIAIVVALALLVGFGVAIVRGDRAKRAVLGRARREQGRPHA